MSDSKNIETLMDDMKVVLQRTERIEANQEKDHEWLQSQSNDLSELKGFMNRAKGVIALLTIAMGGLWALILKFWKSVP